MDEDRWIEREEVIPYTVKNSIMQSIVSFLRSLNLRSDVNTVTSFKSVVEEVSGSGNGFPFTGDATIDGTLNIDFTDTLNFISSDDLSIGFGAIYLTALNDWAEINIDGDTLGQLINTPNDTLILNGVNDVTASLVGLGLSFPVRAGGTLLNINDGDYAGSVLRIAAAETDQTSIGGSLGRSLSFQGDFIDSLGERNSMGNELGISVGNYPYWNIASKTNNSGEKVEIQTNTFETGFVIQNDLSDNEASLLDIRDNSDDTIFEVRNDGLFVGPNIPTADPLVLGQIWSDNGVLTISAGTP